MSVRLVGDLHIRKEEPFNKGAEYVFYQLNEDKEDRDSFIFLGDFFHNSKPFPGDYLLANKELTKLSKNNLVYIMAGNNAHEYHYIQKTWAIDPLEMKNVFLVKKPMSVDLENKTYLMLPWVPTEIAKEYGAESIEELYSDLGKFVDLPKKVDYVLYHFEDETVFMGGVNHGIDLTYLDEMYPKMKRVGGHIHLQSKNYLGTPYQTRYDEKGQTPKYLIVNEEKETYKDLNLFFKYKDIDYDEDPLDLLDEENLILTINNAPSVQLAYEKFKHKQFHIRDVKITTNEERKTTVDLEENNNSSLKEFLYDYLDINKVDKKTSKYLLNLF